MRRDKPDLSRLVTLDLLPTEAAMLVRRDVQRMKRDKPDLSRLVTLNLSPTEAAMLVGILEGVMRARGPELGLPVTELVDGTMRHIRLQLRQLHWPEGHKAAPYPV